MIIWCKLERMANTETEKDITIIIPSNAYIIVHTHACTHTHTHNTTYRVHILKHTTTHSHITQTEAIIMHALVLKH